MEDPPGNELVPIQCDSTGMDAPEQFNGIVSFPDFSLPNGGLRFGGRLYGTTGTGFTDYRVYGMFALVLLLNNGAGRYRDKLGNNRRLQAGDLIVVFPELPHQYGPEPGDVWEEVFISFDGAAFDGWRSLGLEPSQPVWTLQGNPWPEKFFDILKMPVADLRQACAAANAIHLLIADVLSERPSPSGVATWLEGARQALAGGARAPSIQQIAKDVGIGYETFRKTFKAATGESPARYRRRMRLAQAAIMMRRRDLTLEMIAEALDFSDAFHLSKAFKLQYGRSPLEHRRKEG